MKYLASIVFFLFSHTIVSAQVVGPIVEKFNNIRQNGVSNISAYGDTIWISPSLNRNIDNQPEWFIPENADSVVNGKGSVYSYALSQDTIVAGLGFTKQTDVGPTQTAFGYYISVDGGENWRYEAYPIDENPPAKCTGEAEPEINGYDPDCDIQVQYGGNTYSRIRFTVPEQAPPYEVDFKDDVIFSANFGGGLLRSTDFGKTWERILLPPDNVSEMTPEGEYQWNSRFITSTGEAITINRYDPVSNSGLNLRVFGLKIDSQNRVWVGTGNGVNVSDNALTAPSDSIRWKHHSFNGFSNGLIGNWVIEIREDPQTNYIWMTNRVINAETEKEGIVYTQDGGQTFTQLLVGERINDIGFKDDHVFAAGANGLFTSPDGGNVWIKSPPIKSPNTFIKPSAEYYSVASTTNRVWIGTSDGLASTTDFGKTWQITRVDFPLSGGNVYLPNAKTVESYAYPNPFSTSVYELVRIKFEVKNQGNVNVRIFDFGMNLVREIENDSFDPGTYEAIWDGLDSQSRKVANAPYIYVIETSDEKISGKILVVD